jgi:sugar phosphate isomerase/epimerase
VKYSFMSFSCPGLDLDQIFHAAKRYGYAGFEPRLGSGHKHGIELDSGDAYLEEAKIKSEEYDISFCCIATSCSFADPSKTNVNIELAQRSIDLAAKVNSPAIRVFGGKIPEGVNRETSFEMIVEALIKLSDYASQRNVTICVETHDSWCDPRAVADIMKHVNHASVAVNWDIMHPVLTADYTIEASFEILRPWIKHVHVHDGLYADGRLKFLPISEGKVDHQTAIRLLKDAGYNGYISGEWISWEPYDIHLPRELSTMKKYEEL